MKKWKNVAALLIAALIWGCAFVAQTTGGAVVGPYAFICIRFYIGAIVLVPVIFLLDKLGLSGGKPVSKEEKKLLWKAGVVCGLTLGIASMLQQLGIYYGTGTAKAGFLTTVYILIVPILSLVLKKKCGWNIWIAVIITLFGLYLLCMNGRLVLEKSDSLVLMCSVMYALFIMAVDHYVDRVDPVRLSQLQFVVTATMAIIPMVYVDMGHSIDGFMAWLPSLGRMDAWTGILFAGIMSSGVAYTLQVVGQKDFNPTIATLLMSLESVFSSLAGWIILGQRLNQREILGCVIIFGAVILAQMPVQSLFKRKE